MPSEKAKEARRDIKDVNASIDYNESAIMYAEDCIVGLNRRLTTLFTIIKAETGCDCLALGITCGGHEGSPATGANPKC